MSLEDELTNQRRGSECSDPGALKIVVEGEEEEVVSVQDKTGLADVQTVEGEVASSQDNTGLAVGLNVEGETVVSTPDNTGLAIEESVKGEEQEVVVTEDNTGVSPGQNEPVLSSVSNTK